MKLTAEQISNYQNDGVILIKEAFVPWIEKLKTGFDKLDSSIKDMNESLTNELKGINNKLWWNNLFQVVQIYQNRKTNKLLSR